MRYDQAGVTYRATRQADARIWAALRQALGDVASVVNVGAGSGSYEPEATVLAVEPSRVMIQQRPATSAPAVQAVAEALPMRNRSVDAAMAVLTVHHWRDLQTGIAELCRVATRRVVILTWDADVFADFWLVREYLPAAGEADAALAVPMTKLSCLLPRSRIVDVPVPHDCADGFGGAYWRRPHAYLEPAVRAGMSLLVNAGETSLEEGLRRLQQDLADGSWSRHHSDLLRLKELDLGYRLLVADL